MDWTNAFDESGEEEFLFSEITRRKSRMSRLVSVAYEHHHHHRQHSPRHGRRRTTGQQHSIFLQGIEEDEDEYTSHRMFILTKPSEDTEDGILQQGSNGTASSSSSVSSSVISYSNYTLGALYCLSINYILGVGCLGVPYAFARAGFILCGSIIMLVTIASYVTVMWVAESGSRLEMELSGKHLPLQQQQKRQTQQLYKDDDGVLSEQVPLIQINECLEVEGPSYRTHCHDGNDEGDNNGIDNEKDHEKDNEIDPNSYEVIDLVRHYLGNTHSALYQISLMSLMYIGLLAYSQVFCNATSALIVPRGTTGGKGSSDDDGNDTNFWLQILPQLIFGCFVVPLSCVELNEQLSVQAIMAIVRFAAIFIMVGGSVAALFIRPYNDGSYLDDDNESHHNPPYFAPSSTSEDDGCGMSYTACFNGFGVAFSTALFSQLFQHSVPGLLRPLGGETEKVKKVPFVFGLSLSTTCTFYLILGMSAASYFGADTKSSVNLNFANFTFGLNPRTTPKLILSLCRFASSVVVMFPALDTLSVFPLIANTLGSNLLSASGPGFVRWIVRKLPLWQRMTRVFSISWWRSSSARKDNDTSTTKANAEKRRLFKSASRIATMFWRLVAALPPLLGSIWATDLSFSFLLAGVAGVYVAFFAPSLMQLASCRRQRILFEQQHDSGVKKEKVSLQNEYTGWYSRTALTFPVLAFATFALGVVLSQIRDAWVVMRNVT